MFRELEIEYTRFNSARTLRSPEPSEFRVERFSSELIALVDPARRRPGYPNRILGLTPRSLPVLDQALTSYAREGLVPEIQVSSHPDVDARLSELGFRPLHTLAYLSRAPAQLTHELEVERWGRDRADDFLDLLRHAGVELTDELRTLRREHYCTARFRVHVALVDGTPSAWATLFVREKLGFFANAFTLEDVRGRGCQTALLASRLRDAHELGLEAVVTDLVHESASHRNVERAGFRLERVETVWQRQPTH